jgi:hypothetical protein
MANHDGRNDLSNDIPVHQRPVHLRCNRKRKADDNYNIDTWEGPSGRDDELEPGQLSRWRYKGDGPVGYRVGRHRLREYVQDRLAGTLRASLGSGFVVRMVAPRTIPCSPSALISRSTVQRATTIHSRCS